MKKISLVFTVFLAVLSSCQKDEACNWDSTFFNGKTFKLTKEEKVISGVTTNIPLNNPCDNNLISFTATTFTIKPATGCSDPIINGTYTVTTEGGKKYLTSTIAMGGSTSVDKGFVPSYDCSKFISSTTDTVNGVITITNSTLTKQ